jgi:hypothetical protein
MGDNPNTNNMTKSKTQEKLVSNYLTEKQIKSIKVECDYTDKPVNFKLLSRKRGKEYFETNSGYDDVFFTLYTPGSDPKTQNTLEIEIGNFITSYSKTTIDLLDDEISDIEVNLIKLLLKHFTQSVGNSVYIK